MVFALAFEGENQVAEFLAANGIEPGERLVEYQANGVLDEGLGHAQPLDHALGEFTQFQVLVAGQPNQFDEQVDPFLGDSRRMANIEAEKCISSLALR